MFDFEKLKVYTKAKKYNNKVNFLLKELKLDRTTNDQLRRAISDVVCNDKKSKLNFTIKNAKTVWSAIIVWSLSMESRDEILARKSVLYLFTHTLTHTKAHVNANIYK